MSFGGKRSLTRNRNFSIESRHFHTPFALLGQWQTSRGAKDSYALVWSVVILTLDNERRYGRANGLDIALRAARQRNNPTRAELCAASHRHPLPQPSYLHTYCCATLFLALSTTSAHFSLPPLLLLHRTPHIFLVTARRYFRHFSADQTPLALLTDPPLTTASSRW